MHTSIWIIFSHLTLYPPLYRTVLVYPHRHNSPAVYLTAHRLLSLSLPHSALASHNTSPPYVARKARKLHQRASNSPPLTWGGQAYVGVVKAS